MRILLADDETRVRSALRLLLEQLLGQNIVGETDHAEDLQKMVQTTAPDLLLLDWELPRLKAGLLTSLHSTCPGMKIIALSGRLDAAKTALTNGADAFISKNESPDHLLKILHIIGIKE
jgi:DNA-binding NarL/FixJ family response regulator